MSPTFRSYGAWGSLSHAVYKHPAPDGALNTASKKKERAAHTWAARSLFVRGS